MSATTCGAHRSVGFLRLDRGDGRPRPVTKILQRSLSARPRRHHTSGRRRRPGRGTNSRPRLRLPLPSTGRTSGESPLAPWPRRSIAHTVNFDAKTGISASTGCGRRRRRDDPYACTPTIISMTCTSGSAPVVFIPPSEAACRETERPRCPTRRCRWPPRRTSVDTSGTRRSRSHQSCDLNQIAVRRVQTSSAPSLTTSNRTG